MSESSSFIGYSTSSLQTICNSKELGWEATSENLIEVCWKPPRSEPQGNAVSKIALPLYFSSCLPRTQSSANWFFQVCASGGP